MEFLSPHKFIRNPALWLALSLSAGILIGKLTTFDWTYAALASLLLLAAAYAVRQRMSFRVVLVLAVVVLGMALEEHDNRSVANDRLRVLYDTGQIQSGEPVEIEGVLLSRPEASIDGEFLTFSATSMHFRGVERPVSGNVRVFVPDVRQTRRADDSGAEISDLKFEISDSDPRSGKSALKYGSRIRLACQLEREDKYRDPGVLSHLEILDRLGIDATCTLKSSLLVEHIADESVFLPLAWVYDRRADLIEIFRQDLSPRAAGVMIASLLGNKYFLDKDTADLFRDGGTFHILVISGLHITFIGGLLLLFLRQVTRDRWIHFGVTSLVLWGYTLAVGADVPVVRAAVMFTIVLLGYAIHRQGSLLNSLGVCSLLLLAWRPADLFDPSFQLTFVSVGSIVGLAYPLVESFKSIGAWSPSPRRPFPPNVPISLVRFCETLYWDEEAWNIESKRNIWSARLFKAPLLAAGMKGGLQRVSRYVFEAVMVSMIAQL